VGIKEYWISYQTAPFDPKDIAPSQMPNLTISNGTRILVSDLQNGESYYFFVASVDTSGNVSSDWASAKATPSDQIQNLVAPLLTKLDLKVSSETKDAYIVRWNSIPSTSRVIVVFRINNKPVWSNINFTKRIFTIAKTADRKGKTLELSVKAMGYRGIIEEQSLQFKF